ncbi:MAG: HEAT repeat domain-containing protein, partial [Phycisphaerae bacterium]|nr:HEAT repeat domain-containing protein [Phycisphaerae bacterium]
DPSLRTADQIVRMINSRFPAAVTGTQDPSRVDLKIPAHFQQEKTRFLDLVGTVYLREAPGARERRVHLLAEVLRTRQDQDRIAVAMEAFGQETASVLRQLVQDRDEGVRFYAARTMARLDFVDAIRTLGPIAKNNNSPFQEQAVRALARLSNGIGLPILAKTLDAPSPLVRIAAYEGMRTLRDRSIREKVFTDKFKLGHAPTRSKPFVFVARRDEPRIVLFGNPRLKSPVLIETSRILASAPKGRNSLVIITKKLGRDIKLTSSFDLMEIIEKLAGPLHLAENGEPEALDLNYGDVVVFIDAAHQSGAMEAQIVLQPLEILVPGGARPTGGRPGAEVELEPEPQNNQKKQGP